MKAILKKTPIYALLQAYRKYETKRAAVSSLRNWSAEDDRKMAFYSEFITAGDLVFDVGANVGNRCKVFLTLGARTIAIEPQPWCQQILFKGLNGNPLFKMEQCGLAAQSGTTELYVSSAHTLTSMSPEWIEKMRSSGRFQGQTWDNNVTVPTTTMDDMISKHGCPKFVKIDVEGFEHEVISGLSVPVPFLSFEFAREHYSSTEKCITHLTSLGNYSFRTSHGESLAWSTPDWVSKTEILEELDSLPLKAAGDVYAKLDV